MSIAALGSFVFRVLTSGIIAILAGWSLFILAVTLQYKQRRGPYQP